MKKRTRKKSRNKKKKKFTKAVVLLLLLAALAVSFSAWWVFVGRGAAFTGENVNLTISGPSEVVGGSLVTYTVNYTNNEETDLSDVSLSLIYPDGFSFVTSDIKSSSFNDNKWNINQIGAGQSGSITIKGKLFGDVGASTTCAVSLTYQPTNFNSSFTEHAQVATKINGLDLALEAKVPASVQPDVVFEYPIIVKNTTLVDVTNIRIKTDFPNNFEMVSASPASRVSGTWDITKLVAGEEQEIKIKGKISGEVGATSQIKTSLGVFNERDKFYQQQEVENAIKVVNISGELQLLVNNKKENAANPGDTLDYIISYKNTGSENLKEASVVLEFSNKDLLDEKGIVISGGEYKDGKVTWNSAGVKELVDIAPERSGAMSLKIKVTPSLVVKEISDKNFSLKATPQLKSKRSGSEEEITVNGNSVETKINSEIILSTEARYHDLAGKVVGTGPLPPKIGEKTTYRVYINLANRTNDVTGGHLEITLGDIAEWTGIKSVSVGDLKYEGGKVIWDIGRIPANTGQFTENLKANFEVSITPRVADKGKTVELVKSMSFSGSDDFTDGKLSKESGSLDTELETDFIAKGKGKVEE